MSVEEQVIDAESTEVGTEIATVEPGALFKTDDPREIMARTAEVAEALKEFIGKQGLVSKISGRDYIVVEGWQMLGMMLGVTPGKVTAHLVENGWEARVELTDRTGRVVGAGEAECLASEKTWANRDDFARRSMAQTRAVGKAYRNTFGFIAKAAGFEATPAEEMPAQQSPEPYGPPASEKQGDSMMRALGYLIGRDPGDMLVTEGAQKLKAHFNGYYPEAAVWAVAFTAGHVRKWVDTVPPGDEPDGTSGAEIEQTEREAQR